MSDAIVLVAPDTAWPILFEAAKAELLAILEPAPLLIEHMGSTSVPDLPAKPIIDIIVLVADMAPVMARLPAITVLGYEHRPDVSNPERLFFRRVGPDGRRTHHLHVHTDAEDVTRHVLFRDLLRVDSDLRTGYLALKRDLAVRHADNREAYSRGKEDFIDAAIQAAGGPPRRPFWNS